MGKSSNSVSLIGASWNILCQDKEILTFPFLSGLSSLIISGIFGFHSHKMGYFELVEKHQHLPVEFYAQLFAFYLVNYFSITFFSVALISCACIRMSGGDPNVADGFRHAFKRVKYILGWAILEATVGVLLNFLQNRSKGVARWIFGVFEFSWALASYLVVPVFVVEEIGPIAALKKSVELFKKTWGEQLVGSFAFGAISFIFYVPGIILWVAVFFFLPRDGSAVTGNNAMIAMGCIALAAIYFIVLTIIKGALKGIFQAALYYFASEGVSPEGFNSDELGGSFMVAE